MAYIRVKWNWGYVSVGNASEAVGELGVLSDLCSTGSSWGTGVDEVGTQFVGDYVFQEVSEGRMFAEYLVAGLGQVRGRTGTINVHLCTHDDTSVKDCQTQEFVSVTV